MNLTHLASNSIRGGTLAVAFLLSAGFALPMAMPAHAFEVRGLKTPKSFIKDPAGGYFISNINGNPTGKENNGFITKLNEDGRVLHLKFVAGGNDGITLHAPKGLAVIDGILYVTDIDVIWGFDAITGKLLHHLDLRLFEPSFLNDLAHDSDGNLYVTDMSANMILKIETRNGHRASLLARDEQLSGPNGICFNPKNKKLIVVTWNTGSILEVDLDGSIRVLLDSKGLKNLDGVDLDQSGVLYTSSFTDGRIYQIDLETKRVRLFREGLTTPADINLDKDNHLVLIPLFNADRAKALKYP